MENIKRIGLKSQITSGCKRGSTLGKPVPPRPYQTALYARHTPHLFNAAQVVSSRTENTPMQVQIFNMTPRGTEERNNYRKVPKCSKILIGAWGE